jgi:hypothetical protein
MSIELSLKVQQQIDSVWRARTFETLQRMREAGASEVDLQSTLDHQQKLRRHALAQFKAWIENGWGDGVRAA